jgi:hypothetical protein
LFGLRFHGEAASKGSDAVGGFREFFKFFEILARGEFLVGLEGFAVELQFLERLSPRPVGLGIELGKLAVGDVEALKVNDGLRVIVAPDVGLPESQVSRVDSSVSFASRDRPSAS